MRIRETLLSIVLLLFLSPLSAAVIHWGGPRDILADTDVSTNGILIRALAKAGTAAPTVNGVTFGPFPGPDTLASQNAVNYATGALATGGGLSSAYATLLSQNDYRTTSGTGAGDNLTLTLHQLLPGHPYELQLWFHDANAGGLGTLRVRSGSSLDPWVLLDANSGNTAGGRGQYALGTFTADATTQTVQLIGNRIAALQAYQLRLVATPLAAVTWDHWRPTTGPADVATEGSLVRAYAFGATAPATPLNGTAFTRFLSQSTDTLAGFNSIGTDTFGSMAAPFATLPSAYQTLLRGGASGERSGSLTLNNLQPGQWYFVQLWANDSRAAAGGRRQRVNNSIFLNSNPGGPSDNLAYEGGLGHRLQGRFQATASSHRLDFSSETAVQLNALQLRAIPAPDPALAALRYRRHYALAAFRDGFFTSSNPWVVVQAMFATGDFSRARAELSKQAASFASGSLVPTSSFHLWPAVDLYIRRQAFIDQVSRDRMITTLRKFNYRSWSNTSNLSKLAWTMRTLGSQEFGEDSFIFPDNAFRDSDPRGYNPLVARLEQEARQGTGEYASAPYGWYNVMPSLSLAELSTDPALAARARVAFDAHLAQLAAQWMPGGYLATWSGRTYGLGGSAMSMGRLLWLWFGNAGRSGEAQEILMPAAMDYEPPVAILRAASERTSIYSARHRADAFQTAYIYKDQFGFFSHDGSGGGDQQIPDGLRWNGMPGNYFYVTAPAVDTPDQVRASNAPGNVNADYSTLQLRDAQLMVFDLSYKATASPYAIGYVPGNYSAMVNLTGNATPADGRSRIFLNYDKVMVAVTADTRFTWDPASGIYCPWPNVRTTDSEFRIAIGGVGFPKTDPEGYKATIDQPNNRFAVAIEVAHPEEFPGTTAAEKLAAFQAAILTQTSLSRDPATSPTTARYTTRHGDSLRVTSKSGTVSANSPRPAFINDVAVNYDNSWPMMENPWFSQPARGANATLIGGGVQSVLDVTNWTRTDTPVANVSPLPQLTSAPAVGLSLTSATVLGALNHPGLPAATVTLVWGTADAGTASPSAWPNQVALGTPSAGQLFANVSGLSPATAYVYRFLATNSAGTVWSAPITFRTAAFAPPDVPRSLRFTLTPSSVPLAWDPVPDASSYIIRRATTSGGPYTDLATGLTSASYTDPAVTTGTSYYYVVAAVGAGGTSGNSGQLTATPAALPATPAGLVGVTGYRYATLTWTPVPWASSYTVKRGTVSTGPFTTLATDLTATSFEDTTSVHGVRYFYVVSAKNLVGESSNTAALGVTVNVLSYITETSGAWTSVPWFPPARGQPVSATTTIVDFDNQAAPVVSRQDRGSFTLNQLRSRGQNVSLSGDPLTFNGTTPRFTVAATSTSTVSNALSLGAATTFDITGQLSIQAPISGANSLTKLGVGQLTLAQSTTFTGNVLLGGGTVALAAAQPAWRGIVFGATASATIGTTLDVAQNTTATSLLVQTAGPTNRLVIAPGRTFTLNGPLTQGGVNNGPSGAHLTVSGGGAFVVNQPTADFVVRRSSTLDLSAAGPVTLTAARLLVGDLDNNPGAARSRLILPANADTFIRTDRLALSSLSTISSDLRGESSELVALGGPGRFTLRNTAGTGPSLFEVDRNTGSGSQGSSYLVDLRSQYADLWLSELHVGSRNTINGADTTGEFYFDTGILRVDGITRLAVGDSGIARNFAFFQIDGGQVFFTGGIEMASTVTGDNANTDLNITGGTVVSGPISLTAANPGYTIGTLSISGGSLTLTGPITRGTITGVAAGNYNSTGTARIVLEGGTLDLGGHAIGSALLPLQTVSLNEGTLRNVASINGTGGVLKNGSGTLVLEGLNTWTGATSVTADTVELLGTLSSPGTFTLGSEATLTGSGTLDAPVVIAGTVIPGGSGGPALRVERTVRLDSTATVVTRVNRASPAATPALIGATTLTYGGTLRVEHDGSALAAGDRFVLFAATSFIGNFQTVELPALAAGLAWDTRGLRSDGSILVRSSTDLATSLGQTTKYWDRSATAGLQGGSGVWDVGTTANWKVAADGSGAFDRFWPADTVNFQTGATNTVTLSGPVAVTALNQSVNGTATTVTGGRILLDGPVTLSNGDPTGNQPLVLDTVAYLNGLATTVHAQQPITLARGLAGTGDLTKTGASTLTLSADSPWAGALLLGGGTTRLVGATPNLTTISFGPTAGAAPGSTLELNQNLSFAGSAFRVQSVGANVLTIPVGRTLTLTGETALGLNNATVTGVTGANALATTGGGELLVQTGGKNFIVSGSRSGHPAEINLSGLGRAVIDAGSTGNLFVGAYYSNANDSLSLPPDATLTGVNLYVGDANLGGTHALRLGAGPNLINVNNLYVGQRPGSNNRSDASVTFGSATGSLLLRAIDGVGRSNLFINDNISGTGRLLTNTFDVSGHSADLLLNQLVIGRRNATSSPAQLTNDTFRWDRGTLDVQAQAILSQAPAAAQKLHVGAMILGSPASSSADTAIFQGGIIVAENRSTATTAGAAAQGTLTVAGGSVTSAGVTLGNITTLTAPSTGTRQSLAALNVTAGTLTLTGPLRSGSSTGPGTKTATLTLDGGVLDLGGHALGGTGPSALTTLNFLSGTLANVASINGVAGLTKTGPSSLTLAGVNTFTGPITVSAGTLVFTPATTATSSISVASGATLSPAGSITGNLTLPLGATWRVRIDSATTYDQLTLTGATSTATLGGSLELITAPDLPAGTRFRILRNQGNPAAPVAATFSGRAHRTPFTASSRTWYLDYTAGSGGDVDLVLASDLELWRQTHFGTLFATGSAADTADFDKDGVANLLEYALGTSPTSAASVSVPTPQVSGLRLQLSFLRARADVTYHVEASSTLSPGSWSVLATNPGTVGQSVTVADTVNLNTATPPRRFVRLRVTTP